jgi:hypothetical protein
VRPQRGASWWLDRRPAARFSSLPCRKFAQDTWNEAPERNAGFVLHAQSGIVKLKAVKRSGPTNGRANTTGKVAGGVLPKHNRLILAAAVLLIGIATSLAWLHFHQKLQKPNPVAAVETPSFKQPQNLNELLSLSPTELEHCDIARMNLLCAEGLPGAENLNVDESLATLDQWAQHIQAEIDRNFHHYSDDPAYFYNSTNFYKMAIMGVVLYEDYSIRYNPKWMAAPGTEQPDDHFYADSHDILIHGLIGANI